MIYSRPPKKKNKNTPIFLILPIISIILIAGCSNEGKLIAFGQNFFSNIDAGKYDLAFEMLSDEDKNSTNLQAFSIKLQDLADNYAYPEKMDTVVSFSLSPIPDSSVEKAMSSNTPFPKDARGYYTFREIRRIPDVSTLSASQDGGYFKNRREMASKLLSGNFPTVQDSIRYAIVLDFGNTQCVYIGAKYWMARDTLTKLYKQHIKNNVAIESVGSGNIYRTVSYSVVAKQKYKLTNSTRDTIRAYSIKVRGEFNGIKTEPTYLSLQNDTLLPNSQTTKEALFMDSFFSRILGYRRDDIWVKSNIEIYDYPTRGDGPDYDSIMSLKPHAFFQSYAMPVKRGIHKLYVGL